MCGHPLADAGTLPRGTTGSLERSGADMAPWFLARIEPHAGARAAPIGTQDIQQPLRQHRVAIPAALTALDMDQHTAAVDRGNFRAHHLSDAQAGCIGRRECNAIAQSLNRAQETHNLLAIEIRWKLLGLLAEDDALDGLLLPERDAVKEPQRARHLVDVCPRILLADQMKLVGTDILHAELIR